MSNIIYSPSAHNSSVASGFYLSVDTKAPSDAFPVSDADHMMAINLEDGYSYDFTIPIAPNENGQVVITSPTNIFLLQQAKQKKIIILQEAYQAAISLSVTYTSKGGVTKNYQTDTNSINNLQSLLVGLSCQPDALPESFYWVSEDNTQVPFVYEDMQELGVAMCAQGIEAFANLQNKKSAVNAAATVPAIALITW